MPAPVKLAGSENSSFLPWVFAAKLLRNFFLPISQRQRKNMTTLRSLRIERSPAKRDASTGGEHLNFYNAASGGYEPNS
jgi:hypothetical protein